MATIKEAAFAYATLGKEDQDFAPRSARIAIVSGSVGPSTTIRKE